MSKIVFTLKYFAANDFAAGWFRVDIEYSSHKQFASVGIAHDYTHRFSLAKLEKNNMAIINEIQNHTYEECVSGNSGCTSPNTCSVTYLYRPAREYFEEINFIIATLLDGAYTGEYEDGHTIELEV